MQEPVARLDPSSPPPEWVDYPPVAESELCAIGVVGPTYYPEDAIKYSKALALSELARALEVRIKADLTIRQREDAAGTSGTSVQEVTNYASDVVVRRARLRSQWVNPGGYAERGGKGTVYTLMCMSLADQ